MEVKEVAISKIKKNENNPRVIKDEKFKLLVKSIEDFPEMLNMRPLVVDEDMVILGGNMRFAALKELKRKKVKVVVAKGLTEQQKKEFVIKDNANFGDWDYEVLANEWESEKLNEWGLDVWEQEEEVDYSILEDDEIEGAEMGQGVLKAIQIPFTSEDYGEAFELCQKARRSGIYVGGLILAMLKQQNFTEKVND